jgi:capsular exopolysaccharide synthesis family protein
LAAAGRKVLLIDADLRRSQVHRTFDVARSPGLSNVLKGELKATEAVIESSVPGLYLLPAGDEVPVASEPLDTESVGVLIHGFSRLFDLVILDCPPVMALADASIIAHATSSVLFVVGAGTSREVARAAIERLTSVNAEIIGVVLNKAAFTHESAYYYQYSHQSA